MGSGKGGSKTTQQSSNPKWLDDAGQEMYNFAKSTIFQQPGAATVGATSPTSTTGTPSATIGNTGGYTYGNVPTGTPSNKFGWFDSKTNMWTPYGQGSSGGISGTGATTGAITPAAASGSNLIPLEQYSGERFAPLNANQNSAFNLARDMSGSSESYFNNANDWLGRGVTPWGQTYDANEIGTNFFTQEDADRYMNPYRKGVLDVAAEEMDRQSSIQKMIENSGAVSKGSFGGSRQAIQDAERERNTLTNKKNLYTEGLDKAFQTSLQSYLTEAARKLQADTANEDARFRGYESNRGQKNTEANNFLQAAATSGNLATQRSNIAAQDFARLMQAGEAEQANAQKQKDFDFQQFVEKRDYPKSMAEWLSKIISGSPSEKSVQNVQESKPNTLGSLIGAGATVLGGYLSDERTKDNIKTVGWKNGHRIIEFTYKGSDQKYRGVSAQDVMKVDPSAIHEQGGFLAVDYKKINIPFEMVGEAANVRLV